MDEKSARAIALLKGRAELWFSGDVKLCVDILPVSTAIKINIEKQLKLAWCDGAYTATKEYGAEIKIASNSLSEQIDIGYDEWFKANLGYDNNRSLWRKRALQAESKLEEISNQSHKI